MNTSTCSFSLLANSEADTDHIASAFANCIPGNTTVALNGTLGAGKTRFVQGVAMALGANPDQVTSPTFVICNQYPVEKHIYHLDAYRIKDEDEFFELGVDEMFLSDGFVFIEWAEKFQSSLPRQIITLTIEVVSEHSRRFHFTATDRYETALSELKRACQPLLV